MPYLRHIVEQPIDRLYCSLLISLKMKVHIIYVIPYNICYSFLCIIVYVVFKMLRFYKLGGNKRFHALYNSFMH